MRMPVGVSCVIRFTIPHRKLLGPDGFLKSEFYKRVVVHVLCVYSASFGLQWHMTGFVRKCMQGHTRWTKKN